MSNFINMLLLKYYAIAVIPAPVAVIPPPVTVIRAPVAVNPTPVAVNPDPVGPVDGTVIPVPAPIIPLPMCIICDNNPINTMCVPCGHTLCHECAANVDRWVQDSVDHPQRRIKNCFFLS